MERDICTIQLHKLLQLNEQYFAKLVGLDDSVKKIYEGARNDYGTVLEYIQEDLCETTQGFQKALAIIIGLGDDNHLSVLLENLPLTENTIPVNLAAELFFSQRSTAKQLYRMLLPEGNGTLFYCQKIPSSWAPQTEQIAQFEAAINRQMRLRHHRLVRKIGYYQLDNGWRFIIPEKTEFIVHGRKQPLTGCILLDFHPATGEVQLHHVTKPWLNITLTTLFGAIFFNDWYLLDGGKSYSLATILNNGLAIPSVKSPVIKMIVKSVSTITGIGIINHFAIHDCDDYLRIMFGRHHAIGNEFFSVTIQVFFSDISGIIKIYPDHLETDLQAEQKMHIEECLFACNVLTITPDRSQRGKSFWAQMPFVVMQQALSLENWCKILGGFVNMEVFRASFLTPHDGIDNIARCKNPQCENNCMTDVIRKVDCFYTVCAKNIFLHNPIAIEDICLHKFKQNEFNRKLAEQLNLKSDIRMLHDLTWDIGAMTHGKLHQCRIITSYAVSEQLVSTTMRICLTTKLPVVILAVSKGGFTNEDTVIMQKHKVKCLQISDYIGFDADCRFVISDELHLQCFPPENTEPEPVRPIIIPPGTSWEDIILKFIDNHTMVCVVGTQSTVRNFLNCGMADNRTGKPDKNWHLLLSLAATGGKWQLHWQNSCNASREQQRKKLLCSALKKLFMLPDDPIVLDRENIAYICRLKLLG